MYARKLHIAWNHKNSFYQEILRYFRFMFIHWSNFCCSCVADCLKTTFHIFPIENISYFLQLKFLLPFWSSPPLPSPSCLLSLNRSLHSLNNAAVYIESSNQETLCSYLQVAQKTRKYRPDPTASKCAKNEREMIKILLGKGVGWYEQRADVLFSHLCDVSTE